MTTCAHENVNWFMIIVYLNQQDFLFWYCVLLTLHASDKLGRWFIPSSPVTIVLVYYEVWWILLHDIFRRVNLHGCAVPFLWPRFSCHWWRNLFTSFDVDGNPNIGTASASDWTIRDYTLLRCVEYQQFQIKMAILWLQHACNSYWKIFYIFKNTILSLMMKLFIVIGDKNAIR